MNNNFDPTKHKFGMAYYNHSRNYIVWPDDHIRNFRKLECANYETHICDREWWREEAPASLTRSPAHDYIPRDDVMELVKVLEKIANRPDLPNPERDADWKNCQKWSSYDARQALANFKQKYGDI